MEGVEAGKRRTAGRLAVCVQARTPKTEFRRDQ